MVFRELLPVSLCFGRIYVTVSKAHVAIRFQQIVFLQGLNNQAKPVLLQ
jgi:hypothetical protein